MDIDALNQQQTIDRLQASLKHWLEMFFKYHEECRQLRIKIEELKYQNDLMYNSLIWIKQHCTPSTHDIAWLKAKQTLEKLNPH